MGNTSSTGTFIVSGWSEKTSGMDQNGNVILTCLSPNGVAEEHRSVTWTAVASGVKSISMNRVGLIDIVLASGAADEPTALGINLLTTNVAAAD